MVAAWLFLGEEAVVAPTGFGVALLKMVLALVLVCVLAFLLLRFLRRRLTPSTPGPLLRVVESCPLTSRQSVWIVEAAGRYFLVGATEGALQRLAELDPAEVEAHRQNSPEAGPVRFLDILRGKRQGGKERE